jgi:hypothetical protein
MLFFYLEEGAVGRVVCKIVELSVGEYPAEDVRV